MGVISVSFIQVLLICLLSSTELLPQSCPSIAQVCPQLLYPATAPTNGAGSAAAERAAGHRCGALTCNATTTTTPENNSCRLLQDCKPPFSADNLVPPNLGGGQPGELRTGNGRAIWMPIRNLGARNEDERPVFVGVCLLARLATSR